MDWLAEGKVALGNGDGNNRSKTHGTARIKAKPAQRREMGGGTRGHAAWSITITESWRWHSSFAVEIAAIPAPDYDHVTSFVLRARRAFGAHPIYYAPGASRSYVARRLGGICSSSGSNGSAERNSVTRRALAWGELRPSAEDQKDRCGAGRRRLALSGGRTPHWSSPSIRSLGPDREAHFMEGRPSIYPQVTPSFRSRSELR